MAAKSSELFPNETACGEVMSRVGKQPIEIPKGVEVALTGRRLKVKGTKGVLELVLDSGVNMENKENVLRFSLNTGIRDVNKAIVGTTRALVSNMVRGVTKGFEKKLELVGVGFRAAMQGKTLNLTLGYSHPVTFAVPDGVAIQTPSQTEIIITGANKQQVGLVAAKIRAFREPDAYQGKGIKYAGEVLTLKEAKKK